MNIAYGNLPPEWKERELDFCRVSDWTEAVAKIAEILG